MRTFYLVIRLVGGCIHGKKEEGRSQKEHVSRGGKDIILSFELVYSAKLFLVTAFVASAIPQDLMLGLKPIFDNS